MRPSAPIHRRAFTLVEILIVVIILGILGTVVVKQFNNTVSDSTGVALRDDLRTMRNALEIYLAEHGSYPTVASFESQMTQFSNKAGGTSASKTSTHVYGPYLMEMPALKVGVQKGNKAVTGPAYADGFGWQYNATDGALHTNTQSSELDSGGTAFLTY